MSINPAQESLWSHKFRTGEKTAMLAGDTWPWRVRVKYRSQ